MTTTPPLHAQVLALRRTHSARAVAQALSIPLGTVKAISSRSGLTRDNQKLREFFRLPEIVASTCTALQPPVDTKTSFTAHGYSSWLQPRSALAQALLQAVVTAKTALLRRCLQRCLQGIGHLLDWLPKGWLPRKTAFAGARGNRF